MKQCEFKTKDDESVTVRFSLEDVTDVVPDSDMRYTLVVLKNGDKHFICGTKLEILDQLGLNNVN
ncbi:hypothetical protein [Dyadobacter sp. Leaf189]|uniref:hypothetical protein n=1 Tax=unclassified Dyadobacter TaxID=2625061 RepID=UPI0012F765AA|nr:hypothetical protein [Dyadobacter sp. Leaf189]